jgi:hypothetical protein
MCAIPVTGHGGLYACKMLRIIQMEVRLSALRAGRRFTPQKHCLFVSATYFCYRLSIPQGLVGPGGLGKLIRIIDLIGSRTRSAFTTLPHPVTTYAIL